MVLRQVLNAAAAADDDDDDDADDDRPTWRPVMIMNDVAKTTRLFSTEITNNWLIWCI